LAGYSENELLFKYGNHDRDIGFKCKKGGNLEEAVEAFNRAADNNDPVSQYELAHLLGEKSLQYEQLLKLASSKLL
jgi:TPR repeat protein